MLNIVSITAVFIFFMLGYKFPQKAGWAVLVIAPILGPSKFTFVPATLLNLTTNRVAFAVTLGVILSNHTRHGIPLSSIFKSHFVKIVTAFSLFVIIISLEDRLQNLVFTYVPDLIFVFALCFILIKNEKDLEKLVKIFAWQGFVIAALVVIEYFTNFNFNEIAKHTIGDADLYQTGFKNYRNMQRAGFYRCSGIDSHPVQTAYRLTFLFPLALWYATRGGKLWRMLPLSLVTFSFIFLQTRTVFVGISVSLIVFIFLSRKIRIFFKIGVLLLTTVVSLMVFVPSSLDVLDSFIEKSIKPIYLTRGDSIDHKTLRIPVAINYFLRKPFTGYGSPQYVYYVIMDTDDLPSPLIYLLAGGIPLCIIYFMLIAYMPYSILKLSMYKKFSNAQRDILMFSGVAFLGGVVCIFSNWQERHFLVMYMLYISIYKVFLYEKVKYLPN